MMKSDTSSDIEEIYNNKKTNTEFIKILSCATLDDLIFDKTIGLFENLNSLFFLYKERSFNNNKKTRKKIKKHKD